MVEIELTDEKERDYPNHQCCRVKDEKFYLYMYHEDSLETIEESEHEGEHIKYYVWQQTGMLGDDFSGYLLLPLKNGKWWKVNYSC